MTNTLRFQAVSAPESKENIPTSPLHPPSTPESSRKLLALEAKVHPRIQEMLIKNL